MNTVQTLAGKQIVVAVTGSIAAVEIVRLIHDLRRRGAVVQVVMSSAAAGIISPESLTYASGRPAITCISGLGIIVPASIAIGCSSDNGLPAVLQVSRSSPRTAFLFPR